MSENPLFHLAIFDPEIPPNTGNAARVSAAYQVPLHLVGEPKFSLSDKALRRAGVDYWPSVQLEQHPSVWHLLEACQGSRLIPVTTKGKIQLSAFEFEVGDILAFGNESRGLPPEIHRDFPENTLRIDQPGPIRSLNLSTAVGIVAWAAWSRLHKSPPRR